MVIDWLNLNVPKTVMGGLGAHGFDGVLMKLGPGPKFRGNSGTTPGGTAIFCRGGSATPTRMGCPNFGGPPFWGEDPNRRNLF